MRRDAKIVIVGAGIGGLACAIDLAVSGAKVVVLERAAESGGKARVIRLRNVEVAAGPTVLTMPWVFDELFSRAGSSFRDEVQLEQAEILARHSWSDGTCLDLHADRRRSHDAIGAVFGAREARAYLDFCEDGRRMFELSEGVFLRSQRPTMGGLFKEFGARGLAAFAKLDGHRTMWSSLEQRFRAPRLRQLFGRYATYCGSSPFEAPATLNLVAHVEAEGVYRTRGGMRGLVLALERLARSLGVEIIHNRAVDSVVLERGRAVGVVSLETQFLADAVVFNGDVSALGSGLLGKNVSSSAPITVPQDRSLSAVTWAMLGQARGFPLLHHNIFFSDDYAGEFDTILRKKMVPAQPTIYICAQDRGDEEPLLSEAEEPLLVLANAPATGDQLDRWTESEKDRCTKATMDRLAALGLTLTSSATVQTTPVDFGALFPGTGGSLYGPRSKGSLSILSRQAAASSVPGIYLAGGSVHPGPGVPMAALSGRLAASKIREDLASTG